MNPSLRIVLAADSYPEAGAALPSRERLLAAALGARGHAVCVASATRPSGPLMEIADEGPVRVRRGLGGDAVGKVAEEWRAQVVLTAGPWAPQVRGALQGAKVHDLQLPAMTGLGLRVLWLVDIHTWSFAAWARALSACIPGRHSIVSAEERATLTRADVASFDAIVGVSWYAYAKLIAAHGRLPGQRHIVALADEFTWTMPDSDFVGVRKHVDVVACRTQQIMERCVTTYPDLWGRCVPAPDAPDLDIFVTPIRAPRHPPVVGWVGSLKHHAQIKGVELIRAASEQLGLPLVVQDATAPGSRLIPRAEMPAWYDDIDVYVCASTSEGGPNPVLEALVAGRPVVSTEVGIVPALVAAGAEIAVVDRSVDGIAEGIGRALAMWTPDLALRSRDAALRLCDTPMVARMVHHALGQGREVAICTNTASIGGGTAVTRAIAHGLRAAGRAVDLYSDTPGSAFSGTVGGLPWPLAAYPMVVINLSDRAAKMVPSLPPTTTVVGVLHTETEWTRNQARSYGDLKRVDRWWIVDPALRPWLLSQGVDPERIETLPLAAGPAFRRPTAEEREAARAKIGLPEGAKAMLYVGRMTPEKQIPDLITTLSALRADGTDWRLIVVGGPDKASPWAAGTEAAMEVLRANALALRVADAIHWLGPMQAGVERAYWAADVVTLASEFEGLPIVLLEAEACGVPWVAPAVGGIPDRAELGWGVCPPRTGTRYEGADLAGFVDAIRQAPRAPPEHVRRGPTWQEVAAWVNAQATAILGPLQPMPPKPAVAEISDAEAVEAAILKILATPSEA